MATENKPLSCGICNVSPRSYQAWYSEFNRLWHVQTPQVWHITSSLLRHVRGNITIEIVALAQGLPRFTENDERAYRDWKTRVKVHVKEPVPFIHTTITGQEFLGPQSAATCAKFSM